MSRPKILITNDDGITAPGITALVEFVKDLGDIVIVAPDSPQSGQGHAITLRDPIHVKRSRAFEGYEAYECSGTPVDCVKWAKNVLLKGQKPDLCLSGINHGSNVSINIIYSGTMSAAMEAAIEGIQSVGFSLMDFDYDADFSACRSYVRKIAKYLLEKPASPTYLLNVNIPKLPEEEIKGMKVCRQANARWIEDFQEGTDPYGQKYYWLLGKFVNMDKNADDTDVSAVENGYISVVPSQFDLTAHQHIANIKELE